MDYLIIRQGHFGVLWPGNLVHCGTWPLVLLLQSLSKLRLETVTSGGACDDRCDVWETGESLTHVASAERDRPVSARGSVVEGRVRRHGCIARRARAIQPGSTPARSQTSKTSGKNTDCRRVQLPLIQTSSTRMLNWIIRKRMAAVEWAKEKAVPRTHGHPHRTLQDPPLIPPAPPQRPRRRRGVGVERRIA